MNTRTITGAELMPGMTIIETTPTTAARGKSVKRIHVTTVYHNPRGCPHHVHVNTATLCYNHCATIEVL